LTVPQGPNSSSCPNQERLDCDHFRFPDLPPEIRNMVYKEVLFFVKVHFPEKDAKGDLDRRSWKYKKPQLALLRVCKQIHSEAEPL
jgi:hypothetical protein